LLTSIRKVVLVGLSVAAVAACSSSPKADPVWAGSDQGLTGGTTAAPEASGGAAAAAPVVKPSASASAKPSTSAAATTTATNVKYTFPVTGGKSSYAHTHHDYPATDLITACGHTFVAVTSGVVLFTRTKDTWTAKANLGATRGGISVAILGDDGVRYYGSHLERIARGIRPGVRVRAGRLLGLIDNSGDAKYTPTHVHFGISWPTRHGVWWVRRGEVWPQRYLASWRAGGNLSPAAEVRATERRMGRVPRCQAEC
jgi:murein DD-endopeptidase MepM/ murein hydrolase activator NlpD